MTDKPSAEKSQAASHGSAHIAMSEPAADEPRSPAESMNEIADQSFELADSLARIADALERLVDFFDEASFENHGRRYFRVFADHD
jgi:hypothetical protein